VNLLVEKIIFSPRLSTILGQVHDLFFDIEGDHFVEDGGLEYLFGVVSLRPDGEEAFEGRWAFSRQEELAAFEWFVDLVMSRWDQHEDMHVYHFAPYEPAALKRLIGRYGSREDEVDRMLRAGIFVDLHRVTRESVRASVEQYSLKDLEVFHAFSREVPLDQANLHRHGLERLLERGHLDEIPAESRELVQGYNRNDCRSTRSLRDWLEELRAGLVDGGEDLPRPPLGDPEPHEDLQEELEKVGRLKAELTVGVSVNPEERTREEHARWLLAALLEWHRREAKATFWELYRLRELPDEELLYEKSAVAGLRYLRCDGGTEKCPVHRYSYPEQDVEVRQGNALRAGEVPVGSVAEIDLAARTIDIKKRGDAADVHPTAVYAWRFIDPEPLPSALFSLGQWVASRGVDAPGAYRQARDLLLALPPRLDGSGLLRPGEDALSGAKRLAGELRQGVLAVQGPPGSGKTFTGARMVLSLAKAGETVGVTATSHKVVRNFLDKVEEAAIEELPELRCLQKVKTKSEEAAELIKETTSNDKVVKALQEGEIQVFGGTPWLWAREELGQAVDVLFVDEAGQMSLANVLAVAQGAKNLVLLGDPQQLEQPLQGSHPDGAEASALDHLLGEHQTMPEDLGLFLPETWRLHPAINAFTSELFYEGRLGYRPELETQALEGSGPLQGAGLWLYPVEHEGNTSSSPEEVEAVAALHERLLADGVVWVDKNENRRRLCPGDILIVAPYNAQVGSLLARLPGARVGTVDKFQGQEAPIVIYSLTTSSPDDAPRGMEFIYSLNRLNVATSRARAACILVANPALFEPDCRTPRQIKLANALCRYVEMAAYVAP